MSSVLSQEKWAQFLTDSLNADTQASSDAEQRQEYINQANQLYDETVEQAKASALEAGANLIGIGGIETIRATKGLYTAGQGLYTRVQQMKDIKNKIVAQQQARTAKIETLKEQKYNEAQAKSETPIDKAQFMADADEAISKASTAQTLSKVRGAVLEKINPYIDRATQQANNVIDALGSRAEGAVASLTSTANNASNYLKNGFAQYTDTAQQLKQNYLDNFSKAQQWTDTQLQTNISRGSKSLEKFASDSASKGIEGIDEHVSTIRDLLAQGTRQSVAQAGTLYDNLKANVNAVAPFQKLKKAQASIEDAKVSAQQQKADVLNGLEESRQDVIDKINTSTQRLERAKTLPENASAFRNAGVSKDEALQSIQNEIDNHNLDLQSKIDSAHAQLGEIDVATTNKIADLTTQINGHAEDILASAGGASTDLLTRLNTGLNSAVATTGEAIQSVRSAVAPITDAVGALMTPVAVWQGALSAENLIKGHDNGNLENIANDAVNVRFGAGALKSGVETIAQKARGLIGGEQAQQQVAKSTAETAVENIPKTEASQLADVTGEGVGKSAGTLAGEEIGTSLGEAGAEDIAEVGISDIALQAVPVVGEIADVALAGFGLYEGLKSLFGGGSEPPPPPPPPAITQSVSFHGQAGVY